MGLKERLEADQREAMRSGHTLRLGTIRMLRTAIQNTEQARRKTRHRRAAPTKAGRTRGVSTEDPEDDPVDVSEAEVAEITRHAALSDQEILDTVVAREVKQRRDSHRPVSEGGAPGLAGPRRGRAARPPRLLARAATPTSRSKRSCGQ